MDSDELEEDRAAFIAGEIGGVVVDSLEAKRKAARNVIHKGFLRDSAAMVRKGQ
ncbi:hypothetical protein [Citrobacter amalonaticus]|uniref:hypothetical protein n=1 Tax=Citrobacter amalonaticus TaxID=35703 RepID=UPI000B08F6E3|nr:hypothetical protein [Citrobacter amalonaticus]HED1256465.1 hypothetical protein [Citrobacter amalonaticus]